MARVLARTWPKTTSHSRGCAARVTSSTGSWRSLRSSPSATVATSMRNWIGAGAATGSAHPTRRAPRSSELTEVPSRFHVGAGRVPEHVFQGGGRPDLLAQVGRFADRRELTAVHDRDAVAQ